MANKLGDIGRVRTRFLKSGKPSSSQKVGVDSCKLNEKSKTAKSSKIEKKKLSMEGVFRFSSVDPIMFWSAVVLMIASISVIGATVFNVGGERDAVYGDSVNVDYTGSYYDYYDKDGARVFDHSQLKIEIGNSNEDKYPFACALIGHHSGEVIRLCIKNECSPFHTEKVKNNFTIKRTNTFSMSEYKLFFGPDAPLKVGIYDNIDSPYGWPAKVIVSTDDRVIVEYKPDVNGRYSIKGSSAETEVIGIDDDGGINFKYKIVFRERDKCENEKERDTVRIALERRPIYAVDVTDDDFIIYKNNEKAGANLYYVVKFVSRDPIVKVR